GHYASNYTVKSRKRDVAYLQQQLQIAQEEEAMIQITQDEFEFMAATDAYEETERVKMNCTSEDTLQQASTSGTQSAITSRYPPATIQEGKVDMGKALDASLVVTESSETESEKQDTSSRSGNDADADNADIRPIYDEEPMAEVQLAAECNIFATGQHYTEQPEIINEGRVDQYNEQCQVKSLMLDSSLDNKTTEFSSQSLESENILLKKTVAQLQKDFSRMEAHCIALELKYQNQALKSGQHGQILNEQENKTLKRHYKDLYDSIKIMRSKTIEQTTSLLANNADLKAQIHEKVFAIAALKMT
ncbi:hypothetical protein Tco_1247765, partial [Tanacetum coccineum]